MTVAATVVAAGSRSARRAGRPAGTGRRGRRARCGAAVRPGRRAGARYRSSARRAGIRSSGPIDHAARRGRGRGPRRCRATGSGSPNGRVAAGRRRRRRPASSVRAAPQVREVVGVDVGEVLVAARGDERRLGHDGEPVARRARRRGRAGPRRRARRGRPAPRRPRPTRRARARSSTRVTQCTAIGRPAARARRNQPTSTSSGGRRASSRTTFTGPRGSPTSRSASAGDAGDGDVQREPGPAGGVGEQRQLGRVARPASGR